ncbi:C-GCAxxG-C-C family (seleno)protein [Flavobacteriaceae bacterium M23B6Z8]
MTTTNDTKEVFKQCGTCSRTFGFLLNREFNHSKEAHLFALDPLAGGIFNTGHQCGMIWGTTLSIGTEAYHRTQDLNKSIAISITVTKEVVKSFYKRSKTVDCREIIGYDLENSFDLLKFLLKTTLIGMKNSKCFNLAEAWAPEAIKSVKDGLQKTGEKIILKQKPLSCASEVLKKMGGNDEEIAMVSGFAGGLGLSGNGCGALAAAIWMKTLQWCKENKGKRPPYLRNTDAKIILSVFRKETNEEFNCRNICNRCFDSVDDHSQYIKTGGCSKLIDLLAST